MAIKKRPVSPRQKMINLMYVVLMAMLALNVSTEVLNGFSIVEESLNRTTTNSSKENESLYGAFLEQMKTNPEKVKAWFEKATVVKQMSDSLFNYAQSLKEQIVRTGKDRARVYLVKKHVGRSSAAVANYLYDNSAYVLGYSEKTNGKEQLYFDTFKEKVESIGDAFPDNKDITAIRKFYGNSRDMIIELVSRDVLWEDIKKNLSKKYSTFSFRIEGDLKIVAEKKELLQLEECKI